MKQRRIDMANSDQPAAKRVKRAEVFGSDEGIVGIDRLTSLPEAILAHILSLVRFKYSIMTSVLSRSWLERWKQHKADTTLHLTPAVGTRNEEFIADVNHRLQSHPPPCGIHTLIVAFRPRYKELSHVKEWVEFAVNHGVTELQLDLAPPLPPPKRPSRPRKPYPPTRFIFKYQILSLVRLTLRGCQINRSMNFEELVSLEAISLDNVSLKDPNFFDNTIYLCNNLTTVYIRRCKNLTSVLVERGPLRLRSLTLIECPEITRICVSAPKLRHLSIYDVPLSNISVGNVSALEEVCLSWDRTIESFFWDVAFTKLSNVQFLTIGKFPLKVTLPNFSLITSSKLFIFY